VDRSPKDTKAMTRTDRPDPSVEAPWRRAETQAPAPDDPGPVGGQPRREGGWGWLLLLLAPLACCGLPLLAAAGAAVGTATLGVAVGVPVAVVAAVAVGVWLRRRRVSGGGADCCRAEDADRRR
jgi:hypothetical protein